MPPSAHTLDWPMAVVAPLTPATAIVIFVHKKNIRHAGFLSVKIG